MNTTQKLTKGQTAALDYITASPLLVGQQGRAAMCKSAEALVRRGLAKVVEVPFYGETAKAYIAAEGFTGNLNRWS